MQKRFSALGLARYILFFVGIAIMQLPNPSYAETLPPKAAATHDETADRVAIQQLAIEYSYLLDHGRASELAALFTEGGVFENSNIGIRAVGRQAIAEYYTRRAADPRTTRHITTNLYLEFETPDRARGTRLITYFRGDGEGPTFPAKPGSVGEYTEVFERGADSKWRFAFRKNQILFSNSAAKQK